MSAARHGVVLLAAGASRRLGAAKQLLQIDGETLVHRAARLALTTRPLDAVLVYAPEAIAIPPAVADLPVRCVPCADAARGMGATLVRGLDTLDARCAAALVLVCDQPALEASHLQALVETWRGSPGHAVASAYAGTRGVPAMLPRAWFGQVDGTGDRGARALLRGRDDVLTLPAEALADDVDTPAQWKALQNPER